MIGHEQYKTCVKHLFNPIYHTNCDIMTYPLMRGYQPISKLC